MINVEKKIREFLDDEGFDNVYAGAEKAKSTYIPHDSIFVAVFGGEQPQSRFHDNQQIHTMDVQLLVRGTPNEEEATYDEALSVYDSVRNGESEDILVIRPEPPIRLGRDDSDRHRFSINLEVQFED